MGRLLSHNVILFDDTAGASGDSHSSPIITKWVKEALFFLDITVVSGNSPTLIVKIDTYDAKKNDWHLLGTFSTRSTTATDMGAIASNLGEKVAISYTIGGTSPSFTFSVTANLKDQL